MPGAYQGPRAPAKPVPAERRWLPRAGPSIGLPLDTRLRLIIWLAIGLAIYFFYGRSHSVLRHPDAARRG